MALYSPGGLQYSPVQPCVYVQASQDGRVQGWCPGRYYQGRT